MGVLGVGSAGKVVIWSPELHIPTMVTIEEFASKIRKNTNSELEFLVSTSLSNTLSRNFSVNPKTSFFVKTVWQNSVTSH